VVGANQVPYDGLGQRWGDPQTKTNKLFVNAGLPLAGDVQLYGYGDFMDKKVLSSFFYRNPVLPAQYGISGRSTLVSYANGTLVPANAPQSLVDSIVAGGGNPANYLTANAASPSGWELLNPIYKHSPAATARCSAPTSPTTSWSAACAAAAKATSSGTCITATAATRSTTSCRARSTPASASFRPPTSIPAS